ncbi:hypothetical protein BU14_0272s0013 [Porphyra umbilicalis]|uniref:HMA domain-containing protein n=1 Tax=Porphyra umbilicalis TaxID=2786 RepID=A0A1X6P1P9_PORUM|nr:hypothetical protein BU14_0272s0013 [Porphyra umbilicalis]|eukprot:OSX74695.1 hypothetical protein BU14_0272s0013 [Porphyra umbilicalis]
MAAPVRRYTVTGLTCGRCVGRVSAAVGALPGVAAVDVALASGAMAVTYASPPAASVPTAAAAVAAAVAGVCKTATPVAAAAASPTTDAALCTAFTVAGMTCGRCVAVVRDAVAAVDGVAAVAVDLPSATMVVTWAPAAAASSSPPPRVVAGCARWRASSSPPPRVVAGPGVADGRWGGRHAAPRRGAALVATCVGKAESTLTALPGVSAARVNLLAGRAAETVTDAGLVDGTALAAALGRGGYTATVTARGDAAAGGGAADVAVLRIATPAAAAEAVGLLRRMDRVAAAQALVGGVPADEEGGGGLAVLVASDADSSDEEGGGGAGAAAAPRGGGGGDGGGYGGVGGGPPSAAAVPGLSPKIDAVRAFEAATRGRLPFTVTSAAAVAAGAAGADVQASLHAAGRHYLALCLFAVVFTVPLLVVTMVVRHVPAAAAVLDASLVASRRVPLIDVTAWALATPVQAVAGAGFYRGSWYTLRGRRASMDVLIALGTSVAYALAKGHAAAGVSALAALAPSTATVAAPGGRAVAADGVPVGLLSPGDMVWVRPGASFPVDGVVLGAGAANGASHCSGGGGNGRAPTPAATPLSVDESMLTGEARPAAKTPGDEVYVGSLNASAALAVVCVTAAGEGGVLSRIMALVDEAQTARAPIEAFADRVSAVFVPAVVSGAGSTFAVWYGLAAGGALPPSRAAAEGDVLFALLFALAVRVIAWGGEALQVAAGLGVVLFGKTGTLTEGKPRVTGAVRLDGVAADGARGPADVAVSDATWSALAAAEAVSEHPLARALVAHVREGVGVAADGVGVVDSEAAPGRGIVATLTDGRVVAVGSGPWMADRSPTWAPPPATAADLTAWAARGATVVLVSIDGTPTAAAAAIEDTLRPDASAVVAHLTR